MEKVASYGATITYPVNNALNLTAGQEIVKEAYLRAGKPELYNDDIVYFISGVAETNRAPFDVAEGESEIVSGFHVEYSGMAFAVFFLADHQCDGQAALERAKLMSSLRIVLRRIREPHDPGICSKFCIVGCRWSQDEQCDLQKWKPSKCDLAGSQCHRAI